MIHAIRLRRELAVMTRDEIRAAAEIEWLRGELARHEANLRGLSRLYTRRRIRLLAQLERVGGR